MSDEKEVVNADHSFYDEYRREVCRHCRIGRKQIDHLDYGLRHILVDGGSWADSEHVPCAAQDISQWAEVQIAALHARMDEYAAMRRELVTLSQWKSTTLLLLQKWHEVFSVLVTTPELGRLEPSQALEAANRWRKELVKLYKHIQPYGDCSCADCRDARQITDKAYPIAAELSNQEGGNG
jgi:hypothetical protein